MDCSSILTYSDLYSDCYHSYISLHDLYGSVPLPLLLYVLRGTSQSMINMMIIVVR